MERVGGREGEGGRRGGEERREDTTLTRWHKSALAKMLVPQEKSP